MGFILTVKKDLYKWRGKFDQCITMKFAAIILFGIFIPFFKVGVTSVSAKETTSRLYIPTSNQTTILKTKDSQSLLIKDHLGSTRQVDVRNRSTGAAYFPYGGDTENSQNITDRAFTGHRKLEETGVYHAGARFYSPELGAFIQADKKEGPNRYAYALNNPIANTDPTGNCVRCLSEQSDYIDLLSETSYHTEPHFIGNEVFDMPPDQGIPDSIYYPVMGSAVAGATIAGAGLALPAVASSSVVASAASSGSSAIGSALAYRSVQGALGSAGIELGFQMYDGDINGSKLASQAVLGAVGGQWMGTARNFVNPRYAAMIERSGPVVQRLSRSAPGHFVQHATVETAIAAPLIGYGIYDDVQAGNVDTFKAFAGAAATNWVATKTGMKVALLGRWSGGKLGGEFAKKGFKRLPEIVQASTGDGIYFGAMNQFRTNPHIQEPLHHIENGLKDLVFGSVGGRHHATAY